MLKKEGPPMRIKKGNHRLFQWLVIGMLLLIMGSAWIHAIPNTQETTQQPEGVITNKVEDLVGIWEGVFKDTVAYRQFDADGTFKCALEEVGQLQDASTLIYTGRFWFEDELLKITETLMPEAGTYRVRVKKLDGKPVQLSFEDMGDPDSMRVFDWSQGMKRVEQEGE